MYVEIECGGYLKAISGHTWAKPWSGLGSGEGIWMSIRRVNEMNETGQIDITLGLFDNRYEMISWYTLSIAVNSSFYACWGFDFELLSCSISPKRNFTTQLIGTPG